MEAEHALRSTRPPLLPRLVSEDGGATWRIAVSDDENRDDLVWDALFAPAEENANSHWPEVLRDLHRAVS